MSANLNQSTRDRSSLSGNDTWRSILAGLLPLALLVGIIVIALALAALVRQAVAPSGFFAEQQAVLVILIPAFVLAIIAYAVAIFLTLRCVTAWQQDSTAGWRRASAALWALGATALIVLLPLLLAIFLPQHPAP